MNTIHLQERMLQTHQLSVYALNVRERPTRNEKTPTARTVVYIVRKRYLHSLARTLCYSKDFFFLI